MADTRLVQVGWADTNVPGDPILYTMSSSAGRRNVPIYVSINVQKSEEEVRRLATAKLLGKITFILCFAVFGLLISFGEFVYAACAISIFVGGALSGGLAVMIDSEEKK